MMMELTYLDLTRWLYWLLGFLVTFFLGVIGWLIRRSIHQFDESVRANTKKLTDLESALRGELAMLDRRLTRVESSCPLCAKITLTADDYRRWINASVQGTA